MNELKTKIAPIDPRNPDPVILEEAAELLRRACAVVFPTETVYGLGADALSPRAVNALFAIKGRDFRKPLSTMISDLSMLDQVAEEVTPSAEKLMRAFWPGPLTIVFRAARGLLPSVTAGTGNVGVRFPNHAVPLRLIEAFGKPIVATSANLSGGPSPVAFSEAVRQVGGRVLLALDGGECDERKESTVVDCTGPAINILRIGALPVETVHAALEEAT